MTTIECGGCAPPAYTPEPDAAWAIGVLDREIAATGAQSFDQTASDLMRLRGYILRTRTPGPAVVDALKWALPLAKLGIETTRQERLRCGHADITGTYKNGETWAGIHQCEVDDIERAEAALTAALTEHRPSE